MYLSQLVLNPLSRQVQREIAGRYELHRTLMHAFPVQLPIGERILFRLDSLNGELPYVLLQSQTCPEWDKIGQNRYFVKSPQIKEFSPSFSVGQQLQFRLLANPTIKRKFSGEEKSKRVGLLTETEQLSWLNRKAETGGFHVQSVDRTDRGLAFGRKHGKDITHQIRLLAIQFDGILIVEEPEKLFNTLKAGIGSGKGFGFGLLSVAPHRG
jgi:CRISPR system Cascade subunit CasE